MSLSKKRQTISRKAKNTQESAVDPTKLVLRKVERDVLEYTQNVKPCRVDREKGIIYGCKVVGLQSKNGGRYTLEGLREASSMFEGAKCNLNHPDRDRPGKDRNVQDRFGIFHNFMVGEDGAYADLHYLKSHPFAPIACEAAENPQLETVLGFSQNARTLQIPDGNGGIIHESITRVRSIDLVADPATTSSIFESENQTMNDPHTQGMSDSDIIPEDMGAPIGNDPVDEALDALLKQYLPEIKAADKAARKPLLAELKKKIDTVIDALSGSPGDSVTPEATSENPSESEGGDKPAEESVKEEKPVATTTTSETVPEVKVKPDYEQALDVLESCNVQPTSIRVKALLALPTEDRKSLAESWPKIGAITEPTKIKPKSSSVMESAKEEEAKKEPMPLPTIDQLKDDAMQLMAGSRI